MGSYNVRCSVSRLPIYWGDNVKVLIVGTECDRNSSGGVLNEGRVVALSGVMDGQYDDYGRPSIDISDERNYHAFRPFLNNYSSIDMNNSDGSWEGLRDVDLTLDLGHRQLFGNQN